MKRRIIRMFIVPVVLLIASLACNLPSTVNSTPAAVSTLNALYTIAAQTVQAASTPLGSATPLPSPTNPFPTYVTATPVSINTNTPAPVVLCDAAAFVKDITIPDGTTLGRGVNFTKTWRIQNVGICSWTPAYALVFVGGNGMGAPTAVSLSGNVNPGDTVDVSVNMTSPATDGHYVGYWKLRNASGVLFGIGAQASGAFWVDINVSGPVYAAYDFTANYCDASWDNNTVNLPCPGTQGDNNGYVIELDHPVMESGKTENRAGLLTVPRNAWNGLIRGTYPPISIQNGDRFRALVNCQYQAYSCDVFFRLDYQIGNGAIYTLGQWHEIYDGLFYPVSVDLSSLAGRNVKFMLVVTANGSPNQDYALWVGPQIIRLGTPPPPPTFTLTPTPTSTPDFPLTQTAIAQTVIANLTATASAETPSPSTP
jgi:hypothetical protein